VRDARRLDDIIVATTQAPGDEIVASECDHLNVACFRGSESDVLSRYFLAAQDCKAEAIVRITSDCPLFDGALLDAMLRMFHHANYPEITVDYLSNVQRRTFPRGLDAEIFTFAALSRAHAEALHPYEREHVTPYIYEHPAEFRLRSYENAADLSAHRWTLDTEDDWRFIEKVYTILGAGCSTTDVLKLVESRPDLRRLNAHVEQKTIS
jgi:spore coat polysaccharide biosynthesis protein SpsF